jgi:hypothetical protein
MEVEEIDNRSTQHTIHDIAERTTKDQAVAHRFKAWPLLAQHAAQPSRNDQTQRHEKVTLPAASVRQKAECRAGIQDMDNVEEGADFDLFTVGKRAGDGELCELICHDRTGGHCEPDPSRCAASRLPHRGGQRHQPPGERRAAQSKYPPRQHIGRKVHSGCDA